MGARRNFRHHAAEGCVGGDLAHHLVGQDLARPSGLSRTTAAAVSSQVVSMPRTCIGRHISTARARSLSLTPLA